MSRLDRFWNYIVLPLFLAIAYPVVWHLTGYAPDTYLEIGVALFVVSFFAAWLHHDERVD